MGLSEGDKLEVLSAGTFKLPMQLHRLMSLITVQAAYMLKGCRILCGSL